MEYAKIAESLFQAIKHGDQGHQDWLHDKMTAWAKEQTAPTNDGNFAMATKVWPGTAKLLEEMGELQQVLGKLIMTSGSTEHWSGDLRPKLIEELADVMAALRFFTTENLSRAEQESVWIRYNDKLELFREWHAGKDLDSRR